VQRLKTGTIAVVSALGMTAVLGGCGLTGDSEVTLKLVAADYGDSKANSSQKYWDELVKAYEAEHPDVRIDVTVHSWNDVDREVREMVDAGEAPDMAQIGAYADYAAKGLLYRADDVLSIPVQANFVSQLESAGQVNGVQYGMPFAASTRVLFYNKTLFAEAGITPPESWDDLAEAAEALKAKGVKYPYALPLGPEEAQAETLQWLLSGDGGYTESVGSYRIDSAENVATFTWLKDELVGKDLTGPVAPGELNRADAFAAFAKGVEFGMVPTPGVEGPSKATLGVTDWMTAFKQNGHQEQVGDFLDFVYNDDNVLDFSRMYDLLPVTTTASEAMGTAAQDKELRPFLDELLSSELYPVGKGSWAEVSAEIKKRIGRAAAGGDGPEAVLGSIQATATRAESAE
jgi:multiple sugar transport system substrate-binding protein